MNEREWREQIVRRGLGDDSAGTAALDVLLSQLDEARAASIAGRQRWERAEASESTAVRALAAIYAMRPDKGAKLARAIEIAGAALDEISSRAENGQPRGRST